MQGLVWCHNGLTNPNNIDKSAGDAIDEIYLSVETSIPLIVDCRCVSGVTDHAWDKLFKSIETSKREIHFINIQKISQRINANKTEFCPSCKKINDDFIFTIYSDVQKITYSEGYANEIETKIIKKIKEYVGSSFHEYENKNMRLLSSTPIYSNGEFDAAKLVSDPESFFWLSLRLADEVDKIIQKFRIGGKSQPTKLLAVSLRASPFAASIGLLLGLQIETVDHFGPVFKNHETDNSISNGEYIYIGDFTVGGTEIKISKTYALMKNAKLNHAVVIGSLLNKELYKEFFLHSLCLLEECSSKARYSLKNETK